MLRSSLLGKNRRSSAATRAMLASIAVLASVTVLAGCTVSNTDSAASAQGYVIAQMRARAEAQQGEYVEKTLDDLLPNKEFSVEGAPAAPLADGVVFGKVTDVEPGSGYAISSADAKSGTPVAFDDPNSLWRVLVITIKTSKRLGAITAQTIKVGVVINGNADIAQSIAGYAGLGKVAVVLNEPGKFAFDPTLYSIRQSGALLGLVSNSGDLSFPALGAEESAFLGDTDTVDEVVAASTETAPVVDVEVQGGVFERSDG